MTPTDIIERHFAAENAHDIDGTLATYTEDIVWDDPPNPASPFRGKREVARVYVSMLESIPDLHLESVKRFTREGGRYVVDESIVTGHVHGQWAGTPGSGASIRVRLLHVFELRDGLICYENGWLDTHEVLRQIEAWNGDGA